MKEPFNVPSIGILVIPCSYLRAKVCNKEKKYKLVREVGKGEDRKESCQENHSSIPIQQNADPPKLSLEGDICYKWEGNQPSNSFVPEVYL